MNLISQSEAIIAPIDTAENVLLEIPVPASPESGSVIRLHCRFHYTCDANVKSLRVRYSGPHGVLLAFRHATTQRTTEFFIELVFLRYQQRAFVKDVSDGIVARHEVAAETAVDTDVPTSIVLTGQKAFPADEIALVSCDADMAVGWQPPR